MNYSNVYNIPEEFVHAILKRQKQYHKGDADYSVTELLRSPRERLLIKRNDEHITVDVNDLLSSWEGNLIHDAIEDDVPRAIQHFDVNGRKVVLSGKADYLKKLDVGTDNETRTLKDFKTTSVWSVIFGSHIKKWTEQLNCYDYLYEFHADILSIVAYMTDWQRSRRRDKNYPPLKIATIPIAKWSKDEQRAFISERIAIHEAAAGLEDNLLPLCTDEEMWTEPTRYALYKNDNKRATKLFDTKEEAVNAASLTKGGWVDERLGRRRKCEEYCQAKMFCNQWKEYKERMEQDGMEEE